MLAELRDQTPNRLQFTHEKPASGANYYRIAALGSDEVTTFTNTVSVTISNTAIALRLSPNPASGQLSIEWTGTAADASLINLQGQLLKRFPITEGHNALDISGVQPGIYIIRVHGDGLQATERVVIW